MAAKIIRIDEFQRAHKRARMEARLRAEADAARADYFTIAAQGAETLRRAGWQEGTPSAEILGTAMVDDLRQAGALLLASEVALQGCPGPLVIPSH